MDNIEVKNILAAVFDKKVLDPLLSVLDAKKVQFWGTDGTVNYLKKKGFRARSVVAGFDFDGRLKTISRLVFSQILADRNNKAHLAELKKMAAAPFDLVVVDLYAPDPKIFPESMDIGGQAMIRAAIKNWKNVALAFNEVSIKELTDHLRVNQGQSLLEFRRTQAKKALDFIAQRCKLEADFF